MALLEGTWLRVTNYGEHVCVTQTIKCSRCTSWQKNASNTTEQQKGPPRLR